MNCTEASTLIHAYIDRELDAANTLRIEQHLETCASCRRDVREFSVLRERIRQVPLRQMAPAALRERLRQQTMPSEPDNTKARPPVRRRFTFASGAALAATLLLGVYAAHWFAEEREEAQLISQILNGHINAISAQRLTDVRQTHAERLNPWFNSRLDFSPRVLDLSEAGYALLGGRLDSLPEQRIASITYQKQHHIVNIYTWPSPQRDDAPEELHIKQGYNLVYWCQNKMNYWVVSDLDSNELAELSNLLRKKLRPVGQKP